MAGDLLGRRHYSSFYRFFSSARWSPDSVGQCLFRLLLPRHPQTIEAMVDDTLCRRAGPRIFGISMHHDGATSSYGKGVGGALKAFACGHSWVVLSVRVPLPWNSRGCAIPILARLYRSPKRCPESEYNKRTQLAREMVELVAQWLPEGRGLHLTGDREYTCRTVLRDLDTSIQFTGPMPMDALLYDPVPEYSGIGRPRVRGQRVPSPKQRAQVRQSKWRKLSRGARMKRKLPGPRPRGNRGRNAVERTAPFIWAVYGIVIVWYLGEERWQRDVRAHRQRAPWNRSKTTPSFEDMLEALRTEILVHRLLGQVLRNRTRAETRRGLRSLGMAA